MTIQWLVTLLVLIAALVYAGWKVHAYFSKPKKPQQGACDKFSGDCEACMKHFSSKKRNPTNECKE